tara:strand:- start:48 stop:719 length:672 start_codon:yes stop_codon:yes gene_type:complete
MNKNKAIVLVSGGMDSCVTTAKAIDDNYELALLHINYGQRTEKRELQAFNDIANFYQIKNRMVSDITHLSNIGGSCLTDKTIDVPNAKLNDTNIPISYVPFRNANILAIAVSWGEIIHANTIFVGAVEEDSSGYPDCRRSFFDAFEKVIIEGAKPDTNISITTPLINLSKKEIILLGGKLNAPLGLTWSCYKQEDKPCETCDSCVLRARGFLQAKIKDPIINF